MTNSFTFFNDECIFELLKSYRIFNVSRQQQLKHYNIYTFLFTLMNALVDWIYSSFLLITLDGDLHLAEILTLSPRVIIKHPIWSLLAGPLMVLFIYSHQASLHMGTYTYSYISYCLSVHLDDLTRQLDNYVTNRKRHTSKNEIDGGYMMDINYLKRPQHKENSRYYLDSIEELERHIISIGQLIEKIDAMFAWPVFLVCCSYILFNVIGIVASVHYAGDSHYGKLAGFGICVAIFGQQSLLYLNCNRLIWASNRFSNKLDHLMRSCRYVNEIRMYRLKTIVNIKGKLRKDFVFRAGGMWHITLPAFVTILIHVATFVSIIEQLGKLCPSIAIQPDTPVVV